MTDDTVYELKRVFDPSTMGMTDVLVASKEQAKVTGHIDLWTADTASHDTVSEDAAKPKKRRLRRRNKQQKGE